MAKKENTVKTLANMTTAEIGEYVVGQLQNVAQVMEFYTMRKHQDGLYNQRETDCFNSIKRYLNAIG
jgi:hypothetical protein